MTDASVVVGETVEHTCARCVGRDGWSSAVVVNVVELPAYFVVRCECGGEARRSRCLRGVTWRKLADRSAAPAVPYSFASRITGWCIVCGAQSGGRRLCPKCRASAGLAVGDPMNLAAECAMALATRCNACGSDLRSRLETRPYCAHCNAMFGNAVVLPIVAPEPIVSETLRTDGERLWAASDHRSYFSHPLRAEAIRLWREAWVTRERGRIEAETISRRMSSPVFDGIDPMQPDSQPDSYFIRTPLTTASTLSESAKRQVREWIADRFNVETGVAKRPVAAGQLVTEADVKMRPAPITSAELRESRALPSFEGTWNAQAAAGAREFFLRTARRPAIAPPPRVPQVGDEIVIGGEHLRIERIDNAGWLWTKRSDGQHQGVHPKGVDTTWRWPSGAGT